MIAHPHDFETLRIEREEKEAIESMCKLTNDLKSVLQEKQYTKAKKELCKIQKILSNFILDEGIMTPKDFLKFLKDDAIIESINNNNVQPVTINFLGKTVNINNNADNFEALTTFIETVAKNQE